MPGQVLIGYRRDGNKYQADLTDRLKSMQDVAALFGVRNQSRSRFQTETRPDGDYIFDSAILLI